MESLYTVLVIGLIIFAFLLILSFFDTLERLEQTKFVRGQHVPKYTKKEILIQLFIPFYIFSKEKYRKFKTLK